MANIELDGANKKIKVDSGDLTLDVPGDIILDADGADLVFADGGTNILKVTNSSSDVVLQPQVDAKDIIFKQYDGRALLDINDGGFVGIYNGATGPGQLRLYEDTDNGTNYTALQVGTQSGDITYTLPTADGSNGHALTTNGSGTLSWASAGTTYAGIDDQSSSNDDQLTITDTAIVINEDSDDLDFRVESNGNANMLFISGGNDVVGVGAEGDLGVGLHIKTSDSGASVNNDGDELVIENGGSGLSAGMTILSATDGYGSVCFGDSGDDNIGIVRYDHNNNSLDFFTGGSQRMEIDSSGKQKYNTTSDFGGTWFHFRGTFNANRGLGINSTDGTSSVPMIYFGVQDSAQGDINAGGGSVTYNTSSDYRRKENVQNFVNGIDKVKQLKVYTFNFIDDPDKINKGGFFAHEVDGIVPEAVSGEKDEVQKYKENQDIP